MPSTLAFAAMLVHLDLLCCSHNLRRDPMPIPARLEQMKGALEGHQFLTADARCCFALVHRPTSATQHPPILSERHSELQPQSCPSRQRRAAARCATLRLATCSRAQIPSSGNRPPSGFGAATRAGPMPFMSLPHMLTVLGTSVFFLSKTAC